MVKYAANAFLATKITFINEIAQAVRKGRRRHQTESSSGIGHGRDGSAITLPASGSGLWRVMLPERHPSAERRIGQEHAVPMRITETVISVK